MSNDVKYEMSPTVQQPMANTVIQAGDVAVLTCRICGRPRPEIAWTFQGTTQVVNGARHKITYTEDGYVMLKVQFFVCVFFVCQTMLLAEHFAFV